MRLRNRRATHGWSRWSTLTQAAPALVAVPGVRPVVAAQLHVGASSPQPEEAPDDVHLSRSFARLATFPSTLQVTGVWPREVASRAQQSSRLDETARHPGERVFYDRSLGLVTTSTPRP